MVFFVVWFFLNLRIFLGVMRVFLFFFIFFYLRLVFFRLYDDDYFSFLRRLRTFFLLNVIRLG